MEDLPAAAALLLRPPSKAELLDLGVFDHDPWMWAFLAFAAAACA